MVIRKRTVFHVSYWYVLVADKSMCLKTELFGTACVQWRIQKFFTGGAYSNSNVSNLQQMSFTVSVEKNGIFDRRTRHHLPHFLNENLTEVAEMHHNVEHIGLRGRRRSTHSFNILDEELSKFVGVDIS